MESTELVPLDEEVIPEPEPEPEPEIEIGDMPDLTGMPPDSMSPKQRKWLEGIAAGMNLVDAARYAGYSPQNATNLFRKSPLLVAYNRQQMAKAGVTEELIYAKILEGLDADMERERRVYKNGRWDTKVYNAPDHNARVKYLDLLVRLGGLMPEAQGNSVSVEVHQAYNPPPQPRVSGAPSALPASQAGTPAVSVTVNNNTANISPAPAQPSYITQELLNLSGKELLNALMERARKINAGTLHPTEYGTPPDREMLRVDAVDVTDEDDDA